MIDVAKKIKIFAYHESGHAVAHIATNCYKIDFLKIQKNAVIEPIKDGECKVTHIREEIPLFAAIFANLAGSYSEKLIDPEANDAGIIGDINLLNERLKHEKIKKRQRYEGTRQAKKLLEAFFEDSEVKAAVAALAEKLFANGFLQGDEVHQIVNRFSLPSIYPPGSPYASENARFFVTKD